MQKKRQTVLIVEDDWELADGIAWMLEKEGFMPLAAHSVREAEERYQEKGADPGAAGREPSGRRRI